MAAEVIEWVDVDGESTTLDVEWDVEGRFMPPARRVDEIVPLQAGGRLRDIRHGVRDVHLLCAFDADNETALRSALRELMHAMNPTRGDGRLRVTAPGGDQRELFCRYFGGLEMPERIGVTSAPEVQYAPLIVRAVDPYWYDVATTTATYATGEPAPFFPIFPLRLASSEVFADASLTNNGDVESWPTWTIVGPASAVVLRNLTTGKALTLDYALAAGDTITIDTRPGEKSVLLDDGSNLFSALFSSSATSSLWPLAQGVNAIRIEVSGATVDTEITVSYKRRYLSA